MTDTNGEISTHEAKAALNALESAKIKSIKSFRPPLWLNFYISLFVGIVCFATPLSSGNSKWTFIMLVSAAATLIGMAYWYIMLRVKGVKQNIIPFGSKNKIFALAQTIVTTLLILGSIQLYKAGFLWTPYVAGPLTAVMMFYLLYSFPTGEWE